MTSTSRSILVLASASPRRTRLLSDWGVPHIVMEPRVDEALRQDLEAGPLAERLAIEKVRDVWKRCRGGEGPSRSPWVLAADTIVSLEGRHLGKPESKEEALAMLEAISARDVRVVTGVAVIGPARGEDVLSGHELTVVHMHSIPEDVARAYVCTGEPFGKAGAFAIQGDGARLIRGIEGSRTNVIGLPRDLSFTLLGRAGFAP